jgi:hypothetical protein
VDRRDCLSARSRHGRNHRSGSSPLVRVGSVQEAIERVKRQAVYTD